MGMTTLSCTMKGSGLDVGRHIPLNQAVVGDTNAVQNDMDLKEITKRNWDVGNWFFFFRQDLDFVWRYALVRLHKPF